jgi:tRNA pseudouridine38-40 synthase
MEAPELRRICLTIEYDGGAYHGWQLQPDRRTVQGELEAVVSRLTARPTRVLGSGRTDRGVHAVGQVAAVDVPAPWTPERLQRAMNALLPAELRVSDARRASPGFHPRYDAESRAYVYRLGLSPVTRSPFLVRWCWPLAMPLDVRAMEAATRALPGEHSFLRFAKAGQEERGDRCTVHEARWEEWPERGLELHVAANRFLHHMVRYLVGTLVDVGRGRRPVEDLAALLEPGSTRETSPPAPPEGLFLRAVRYPAHHFPEGGPPPEPAAAALP